MSDKVIVCTMWNRPEYDALFLTSLKECVGIGEYRLVMCVDPGDEAVVALAKSVDFCKKDIVLNRERLGCQKNTFQAWLLGFALSDYVIYTDDDVLLAPDCLRYFEWCRKYAEDRRVFTISAYQTVKWAMPESVWYRVEARSGFCSFTMAAGRRTWEESGGMKETWDHDNKRGGWDIVLDKEVRRCRIQVKPAVSRVQNIGVKGLHTPSEAWFNAYLHCTWWAGAPEVKDQIKSQAAQAAELFHQSWGWDDEWLVRLQGDQWKK
jgi:hypothetical protein